MAEYLPEEVVVQILSRLPAKSVLKFSCVCKLWNRIVKSPDFISTFSSNKHDSYVFLLHSDSSDYQYSMHLENKDSHQYPSLHPLSNPASRNLHRYFKVIGSSNGLICLYFNLGKGLPKFIIWNPSIRKSVHVPPNNLVGPDQLIGFGFGFDSRTNDYKLLEDGFMYSLNCNSWKKISNIPVENKTKRFWLSTPLFVHGRFHWLAMSEKKNMVLTFDLRDEMFGGIAIPQCLENVGYRHLKIKAFGESSMAVTHQIGNSRGEHDIRVMKEYWSSEWTKLAAVERVPAWCWKQKVSLVRDSGEVVLIQFGPYREEPRLVLYNIKNGLMQNVMIMSTKDESICCFRHVESLALFHNNVMMLPTGYNSYQHYDFSLIFEF
ncbi:F-box/kelch-repeat protein At3g06240-like [Mercurialis annua]|uniref:F-box/kelch-repeat protein At3g06240-like n=1 Tax=Mercurialis annua TaxID=3986 RepID=UPI00215E6443|nr:F-box/kelch-repeat protein At3g06240-like [Mercurialis annua]